MYLGFKTRSLAGWEGWFTPARVSKDHTIKIGPRTTLADAAGHAATPQIRNMATVGGNLLQRPRCWYFRSEQFHCLKKGCARCFAIEGENQYHAIIDNKVCAIVHPSGTATALVALGAKLELTGPKGKREIALEEFFVTPERDVRRENTLGANELVTEIRVPAPADGLRSAYLKQREKESFPPSPSPFPFLLILLHPLAAAPTVLAVVLPVVAG